MQNSLKTKSKRHVLIFLNAKKSLSILFFVFLGLTCSTEKKNYKNEISTIREKMQEQEDAWNEGDLEGFMKHYWKSDSLRFIGRSGLNKGWQTTLDNYKKSYKNKREMGTLKFANKSIDILGEGSIFVIGQWLLSRGDSLEDLGGMYSLIWEKKEGKWVITTDHSS